MITMTVEQYEGLKASEVEQQRVGEQYNALIEEASTFHDIVCEFLLKSGQAEAFLQFLTPRVHPDTLYGVFDCLLELGWDQNK